MAELPTGTVTFLFTDVEGSTKASHELSPNVHARSLSSLGRYAAGYGS